MFNQSFASFRHGVLGVLALALLTAACSGGSDDAASGGGGNGGGSGDDDSALGAGKSGANGEGGDDAALPTGDCVVKTDVTKNTTWSPALCPTGYLLKYETEVRGPGVELHLEPGTKLLFASTASLTVHDGAALVAIGTPDAKVVFEGTTDDVGAWVGLRIRSNSTKNELSQVVIKHAGSSEMLRAALSLSEEAVVALRDVEIVDNQRVGFAMYDSARLTEFSRVVVRGNAGGAGHVGVPHVKHLRGDGNIFENNGNGNSVIVEATALLKLTQEATWPSISPAVYRIAGQGGSGGGIVKVEQHLTIEPGAVFELTGSSGFLMDGAASGLRAIGTPDKKIVFRGIDGSSWSGLTFGESTWAENRLEHVEVRNASSAPSWGYYGTGNPATPKAGILLGYNQAAIVSVTLKDFVMTGPNNAPTDVAVKGGTMLNQEGVIAGTGAGGVLTVQAL